MNELKLKDLFCTKAYIAGAWCDSEDNTTDSVSNPATGETIGTVPSCTTKDTQKAIDAAEKALASWQALTAKERGVYLLKWHDLINEHINDLSRILTLEQGKPLAEALGEIVNGVTYISWFVEESKRVYGQVIPAPRQGIRPITFHQGVGVVGIITPWNFPSSMILRKAAAGLAAGCTLVIKPATATPFSAIALVKLAEMAGIPQGVINIVTGSASIVGEEICTNKKVRKISFTGSTEVGKVIMEKAAKTVKRTSMELGGNAPFIVFDDADLELTINNLMACKFRNAGQTCICANRILVQKGIYGKFLEAFEARISKLVVGNGLNPDTTIGPVINDAACVNMESLVNDAFEKKATIRLGGYRIEGQFFEPTLISGVTRDMRVFKEEIFGPIAAVMSFETEEEVIELANDTNVGLASYVMTNDLGRSWRMMEALEYGMVGINDITLASAEVPFGGIKESGTGREGGTSGILDYMNIKYSLIGNIAKK